MASCNIQEEDQVFIQTDEIIESELEALFLCDGSEEKRMNNTLFELANMFEFDILNPSKFSLYRELFREYEEVHLSRILNSNKLQELKSLEQGLSVREIEYCSCLIIPNISIADFSLSPIIAIGVGVEYDDIELIGDVIVGWYYNEDGFKELIYLDEKHATNIKQPVLVISNDDMYEAKVTAGDLYSSLKKSTNDLVTQFPESDCVMIQHRFEGTGDSDVFLGYAASLYVYGFTGGVYDNHLRDISKDQLGNFYGADFFSLKDCFRYVDGIESIYMVSFEKDPFTGRKSVTFQDGQIINNMVKMTFLDEWYVKTYARYDENADLEYLYGSEGYILVLSDKGGLVFGWSEYD